MEKYKCHAMVNSRNSFAIRDRITERVLPDCVATIWKAKHKGKFYRVYRGFIAGWLNSGKVANWINVKGQMLPVRIDAMSQIMESR